MKKLILGAPAWLFTYLFGTVLAEATTSAVEPSIWVTLVKELPVVAAVLIMAQLGRSDAKETRDAFLKAIYTRDKLFADSIKTLGNSCHEVQEKATAAIERNTAALGRMEGHLDRLDRFRHPPNGDTN